MIPLPHNNIQATRPTLGSNRGENAILHLGSAKDVPTLQQAVRIVDQPHKTVAIVPELTRKPLQQIYSPRQAPSAVTSENYLAARALMTATFVHNIASSKEARISNLYKEAPKFREQIDILA
jgi:hypothetical protein